MSPADHDALGCCRCTAMLSLHTCYACRLLPLHGHAEPAHMVCLSAECLVSTEHRVGLIDRLALSTDDVVAAAGRVTCGFTTVTAHGGQLL